MHELAITKSLMDSVLSEYKPESMGKIISVSIVMGQMLDYEQEWMQKFLDRLSPGTPLEGTKLFLEKVPVRFKCRECGGVFPMEREEGEEDIKNVGCPFCGSLNYDMCSGREFYIKEMTVEKKDEA